MNFEDCIALEKTCDQKISVLNPKTLNEIVHQRRPTLYTIPTITSNESPSNLIIINQKLNNASDSRAKTLESFPQPNQN